MAAGDVRPGDYNSSLMRSYFTLHTTHNSREEILLMQEECSLDC